MKTWDEELLDRHSRLFSPGGLQNGLACKEGWSGILSNLFEELELLCEIGVKVEIQQTKEKFGSLHVYADTIFRGERVENLPVSISSNGQVANFTMHAGSAGRDALIWNRIIEKLIEAAQTRSAHTCERTGKAGCLCKPKGRRGGWLLTLSPEAAAELDYWPVEEDPDLIPLYEKAAMHSD